MEGLSDMPTWMSIIPPLVAIGVALILKEVISALITGILSGTLIYVYFHDGAASLADGLLMPVELVLHAVVPSDGSQEHISVIVFSMLIGAMANIITANGSMRTLVERLSRKAVNKKQGLFLTWLMGVIIFFDDYANTMVVGNTMRPLTDRLKISREKLAYIVDSTAAPIAAIALVTTWIGAEINFIEDGVKGLTEFPIQQSAYGMFLASLKYSFYPILTLLFILILIKTGKDFGAMHRYEHFSDYGATHEEEQKPTALWRGLVPVAIILFGTLAGLFATGYDPSVWNDPALGFTKKLSLIIGNSDSFKALLWSSYAAVAFAIFSSIKVLGLGPSMEKLIEGFQKMLPAITILILAWTLAELTEMLGTANFVSELLTGKINPVFLPALTFIGSAFIAFATGSSWGTMAILYPVLIGLSWKLGLESGLSTEENYQILLNVISTVLAGSVLGDHCSPISDTTILSSLATECDHMTHVRTQMPYALTVGAVSLICGTLLSAWGVPVWICFIISILALTGIVSYFGKLSQ